MSDYTKFKLLSIDAWRDGEGHWVWNDFYLIEDGICFTEDSKMLNSNRLLLKYLRDNLAVLSDYSKGRVKVERDCDIIEIQEKNTGRPLFALSAIH